MKRFIINSLNAIEYFQDIGDEAMHEIIYSLKGEKFHKGDILQHQGNNSSTLYFLQDGVIEIYSEFDG